MKPALVGRGGSDREEGVVPWAKRDPVRSRVGPFIETVVHRDGQRHRRGSATQDASRFDAGIAGECTGRGAGVGEGDVGERLRGDRPRLCNGEAYIVCSATGQWGEGSSRDGARRSGGRRSGPFARPTRLGGVATRASGRRCGEGSEDGDPEGRRRNTLAHADETRRTGPWLRTLIGVHARLRWNRLARWWLRYSDPGVPRHSASQPSEHVHRRTATARDSEASGASACT